MGGVTSFKVEVDERVFLYFRGVILVRPALYSINTTISEISRRSSDGGARGALTHGTCGHRL